MCDYDVCGPDAYMERWRKARKEHRCQACGEAIRKGDRYNVVSGIWDGRPDRYKRCVRCVKMYEEVESRVEHGDPLPDLLLGCGYAWDDVHGKPPPDDVAALAFVTREEMQR